MRVIPTGTALALLLSAAAVAPAATATSLSSFEGKEEPAVLYNPLSKTFTPDSYVNMTDQAPGVVRFELRYRSGQWWDGDRTTTNTDRQRAEVKGLGPHQKPNETFEYVTNWRTNPTFTGSGRFCHFFQLKATDGDDGAPLVVASIASGQSNAYVRYWPGTADNFIVARNFNWAPDTWQNLKIRIGTSNAGSNTGEVRASVNGDALAGLTGVAVYRPDSTDYRPKWGLYRGVTDGLAMLGDDYVEHKDVTANKTSITPPPPGLRFEAESIPLVSVGAPTGVMTDAKNSAGKWMALLATGPGPYVEYTLAAVPAGTYDVWMKYKSHPNRGILTMQLDGAPIGPASVDQYSNPQNYPEIFLGTVHFDAAGSHVIRQTAIGKNPLAGAFTLSADLFTLLLDKTPPVITVPDDIEVEATGPDGAAVTYAASAVDDKDGEVPVTLTPPSGSVFPLGESTVAAIAVDSTGNKATDSFLVTVVDTTAPALALPADLTAEATSASGAIVTFGAAAHDLVSGDVAVTLTPPSGSLFALGTTTVTASATDAAGNTATGTFTVTVRDATPPAIGARTVTPHEIWPPNHTMIPVVVGVEVHDAVDPAPDTRIVSVTSNEPTDGSDWVVTGPLTLELKAERAGEGTGRVYTIVVASVDHAGNASTVSLYVVVPHDRRR
jgi:hypothetical protein